VKRILPGFLIGSAVALFASIAHAQIVIVSSARGAVQALSRQEAEQLYLGRTRNLSDGTPVALADLPPGPVRDRFYEELAHKNPSQIRAHWSRMVFTGRALPPQEAASVAELRARVGANPNLIGYLPAADADSTLRVLLQLP
jgi:hypothetical protein